MVHYTDYPRHGEFTFSYSDLQQNGELNLRLVSTATGETWILQVFSFNAGEKTLMFSTLNCFGVKHYEEFRVSYYLGFLNHQDESKSEVFIEQIDSSTKNFFPGPGLVESQALDKKNGWLENGKLTVVFGIHVEAFKETVWKFNCYEPMFRHTSTGNTVVFGPKKEEVKLLFSHKQLPMHHFPFVSTMDKRFVYVEMQYLFDFDSLEKCLQILNGARMKMELNDILNMLKTANFYELYNVIRYSEMELIQRKDEIEFIKNHIQFASHHKLSRYLASVLREMESPEAVKENFRHVDIDSMTGEMMKQCVIKLLGFY